MALNVNLGTPYQTIIENLIRKGYAASQTEAIRQALMYYDRHIGEEEAKLVSKGVSLEMAEIRQGKVKTKRFSEIKKKYGL